MPVGFKFNRLELLYKIVLCLLVTDAALYNTTLPEWVKEPIHQFSLILVLCTAVLWIWLKRYTLKFLFLIIPILSFALVSYKISGNTDIFTSLLLIMLAWGMNADDILKTVFNIRLFVFILTVMLSLIGVLEMGAIATVSADKGVMFGYGHANTFAGNAGILVFLMFAVNRKKIRNIHFVISIVSDIVIFYFSRSRTGLLLISSLIMILLLRKYFKIIDKLIIRLAKYVLPILLFVIFLLIFLKSKGIVNNFVNIADKLSNGRILLSCMNLEYYPVTVLGQRVDISVIAAHHTYYALDNGFVYILIYYGIVGLCVVMGLQELAIVRCVKMKEIVLCIISCLILCWLAYEGMMVSATSNFSLLFSVAAFNNGKIQSNN